MNLAMFLVTRISFAGERVKRNKIIRDGVSYYYHYQKKKQKNIDPEWSGLARAQKACSLLNGKASARVPIVWLPLLFII